MTRILLVEDDQAIAMILKRYLTQSGKYELAIASCAKEALQLACDRFDVILLDIMLPDTSGIDLCAALRRQHKCPIIFISCLDNSDTIIQALGRGGDDYMTKPFDAAVLEARIEANLRRVHMDSVSEIHNTIRCNGIELNALTHDVIRDGKSYHLEDMEYQIMLFFMQHPDSVFSTSELYEQVWGHPCYGDIRTVTVHIFNLRRIIEENPRKPEKLINIWGKGYCFLSQSNDPSDNKQND